MAFVPLLWDCLDLLPHFDAISIAINISKNFKFADFGIHEQLQRVLIYISQVLSTEYRLLKKLVIRTNQNTKYYRPLLVIIWSYFHMQSPLQYRPVSADVAYIFFLFYSWHLKARIKSIVVLTKLLLNFGTKNQQKNFNFTRQRIKKTLLWQL